MNHDQFNNDLKVIQDAEKEIKSLKAGIEKQKKIILDAIARMNKQVEVEEKKPRKKAKKDKQETPKTDPPENTNYQKVPRPQPIDGGSTFNNPNLRPGA